MDTKVIAWPTERTRNWETFHDVCAETFGFPDYYGRNMNAWIDCMTYLDEPDTRVSVAKGGLVVIRVEEAEKFASRCPEQHAALLEYTAFVNHRRVEAGEPPILALMLVGHY
jgi:hypothetical protein